MKKKIVGRTNHRDQLGRPAKPPLLRCYVWLGRVHSMKSPTEPSALRLPNISTRLQISRWLSCEGALDLVC
ncbi:hypothetical protein RRG08_057751 [Elysia crispata]|uniref:Uncharacterized protein n=1 Tax=Elysia crispata TaxID=231223 RepID=A0AAE0YHE0_9GAST|nr:hypothetical protein RRG08_057751 [Elysia crispata]